MENIKRIMQEIKVLSLEDKIKLNAEMLESCLRENSGRLRSEDSPYYSVNMKLPVEEALRNLVTQRTNGFTPGEAFSTGFSCLDKHIHGFDKGSLTIIGARPAIGKKTFLLNLVRNMLSAEHRVGFVSIDLNAKQLAKRMLLLYAGITPFGKTGKNEEEHLQKAKSVLELQPLYQQTYRAMFPGIGEVLRSCENMIVQHEVEIIFIDYLQLIDRGLSVYSDCENADSGYVITELTRFAREYNIPLVITSSLTRNVTLRSGDKRPIISDLAGSDFIEELADNIILLHRPAYYGIIEDENGNDLSNVTEVIIAKSKDGTPGEIYLRKKPGSMILE